MKYKRKDTKGRFGSGRVIRRLLTFLSASLLCLGMTISAFAGISPVGQKGSLTLNVKYVEGSQRKDMESGKLAIYLVGPAVYDDGDEVFDIGEGRFASEAAVQKIPDMDSAELEENNPSLSKALDGAAGKLKPDAEEEIEGGKASFEDLTAGLYFVRQTQASDKGTKITSFLASIPDKEGNLNVVAEPKPEAPRAAETKETETETGSETETEPETKEEKSRKKLPQTGQLWWPVPVFAAAGLAFLAAGAIRRRSSSDDGQE